MPQCCAVPMCSKKMGGHKFPKDKTRLIQWLKAIRRDHYTPSKHSVVCKNHFTKDDYELPKDSVLEKPRPMLKKDAVPSIFSWNEAPSDLVHQKRKGRYRRCADRNVGKKSGSKNAEKTNEEGSDSSCEKESFNCIKVEILCISNDVGIQCDLCECDTKLSNDLKSYEGSKSNTKIKKFKIENVLDTNNPEEVQFFTGFQNFKNFKFIFNLFGDEVNHLKYYPHMKTLKENVLRPCDEFLMTMIKLRQNTLFVELAFRFNVNKTDLTNIFITWINYLYHKFFEVNHWVPKHLIDNKNRYSSNVIPRIAIIDCTEIKIEKSENPVAQQLTSSKCNSYDTLKMLVGISASGCITFVSDAYVGSLDDCELFEKCGLMDKLKSNDIIWNDCGLNVQNLVDHKDVTPNMAEFLKNIDRQLKTPKKYSAVAIHVERHNDLAKTFNILSGKLDSKLVPLADRIIFVCFMLTNFKSNIVKVNKQSL